jgi:ABC-type branched-subunit amino acid transport system ATPase component
VTPLLQFEDVAKSYGGVTALDGVTFDVGDDEVVGVIGANGAGKTTAFDAISGFVQPDRGRIWLRLTDGSRVDLAGMAPHRRAALGVGRTFQNARLFSSLTVLETLRAVQHTRSNNGFWKSVAGMGAGAEREISDRAHDVLALVGLEDHLDKPVQELSYGMLRLCELACVVALAPRLLLLDEPSSGMAQREVEALGPILESVRARLGASIVLVEHDMPFVLSLSSRIVAMAKGTVIAEGPPPEVMTAPAVIESYLGDSWSPESAGADRRQAARA